MGLACVVFGAVLAPWVVRNERVLHAFVPTRGNLGVELYKSTLERNDGFPWGTTLPLWPGDPEFKQYEAMGEVRYSAMRGGGGEGADFGAAGEDGAVDAGPLFLLLGWDAASAGPASGAGVSAAVELLLYQSSAVCWVWR